jgi:hypothetical protein
MPETTVNKVKRRPGRPTPDLPIGQRFGRLTIIGRSPSPRPECRHVRLAARCDCGRTTVARRADIVRGFTKSCTCGERDSFKRNWDTRAEHLPESKLRSIAVASIARPFQAASIALRHRVSLPLVGAAFRVHTRRLVEKFRQQFTRSKYNPSQRSTRLSTPEFRWLTKWFRKTEPRTTEPLVISMADLEPEQQTYFSSWSTFSFRTMLS